MSGRILIIGSTSSKRMSRFMDVLGTTILPNLEIGPKADPKPVHAGFGYDGVGGNSFTALAPKPEGSVKKPSVQTPEMCSRSPYEKKYIAATKHSI